MNSEHFDKNGQNAKKNFNNADKKLISKIYKYGYTQYHFMQAAPIFMIYFSFRLNDKVTLQISAETDSIPITPTRQSIGNLFLCKSGDSLNFFQFAFGSKETYNQASTDLESSSFYYHLELSTNPDDNQKIHFLFPGK